MSKRQEESAMGVRLGLGVCVWLSLCSAGLCGETSLGSRLSSLAKAHKGKVAIAVKHLNTGESYYLHADDPMSTASLVKLPVMIEVYQQVAEGKIKLSDPVTLREEDKVPGSGVLTHYFSPGLTFPLRDAVRLMIDVSDNTATNLVLDKIGIASTGKRMAAWGFPETKINAKSFRGSTTSVDLARSKRYGLGSTTAREMVGILEKLQRGEAATPEGCKEILAILQQCEDKEKFPRFLPEGVKVAHKTGSLSDARTDAGILSWPAGPVALCVLTNNNEDHSWVVDNAGNVFCSRVAREVYDYFNSRLIAPATGAKK